MPATKNRQWRAVMHRQLQESYLRCVYICMCKQNVNMQIVTLTGY